MLAVAQKPLLTPALLVKLFRLTLVPPTHVLRILVPLTLALLTHVLRILVPLTLALPILVPLIPALLNNRYCPRF
ncbi:MAG: hypothetical protein AAFQ74_10085 [Cyanobacteria bacterium J06623_4]